MPTVDGLFLVCIPKAWGSNCVREICGPYSINYLLGARKKIAELVAFPWPNLWHQSNIIRDVSFLELIPVVLSVVIWGKYWITTTKNID